VNYREGAAIVTGASSGIGRQIALDLAARGTRVLAVARRRDRLEELAERGAALGARVEPLVGDLADRAFLDGVVPRALERFGRLDLLVNNAGIPKHKQIYDVTPRDVEHTLAVNFLAPALLTLAALPPMLRQGQGWLVNVSSLAGRVPPPRETVYAATKYALTGLSEGLAIDLAGSNIHPIVLHVGPIDTEIWEKAASEAPVRFTGRKHPPSAISNAMFDCIEKGRSEATVPRSMWMAVLFKLLLPRLFRKGSAGWDPVSPEVVEAARRAAHG
jgi:short-subunit dehydrogenase